MSYYSPNPHYAPADYSEDHARRAAAEFEGSRWFNDLTKPQAARHAQRMADALPYKGSPRWERMREAAMGEFVETTTEASEICNMVIRDMLETGEVSEATSYAFDECITRQNMALQAAE